MTLSHFSNSYSAHGMLFLSFLASLSLLAFSRPMYIFVGPVTHCSCRLGLMGFFAIYPVNSLWPSSLGSSVCWASTNGPQHLAPWTYEMFLRFICEWKGASALLLSSFFFSFFAGPFFFLSCGPLLIHTYILLPAANRVVSSNFPVWQLFSKQSRRFINSIPFWWLTRHLFSCWY